MAKNMAQMIELQIVISSFCWFSFSPLHDIINLAFHLDCIWIWLDPIHRQIMLKLISFMMYGCEIASILVRYFSCKINKIRELIEKNTCNKIFFRISCKTFHVWHPMTKFHSCMPLIFDLHSVLIAFALAMIISTATSVVWNGNKKRSHYGIASS